VHQRHFFPDLPMNSIHFGRSVPIIIAMSVVFSLAKSGEWWDEKPVAEWSSDQAHEFLNNSPWVSSGSGYFEQAPWARGNPGEIKQASVKMIRFQARILTARPVREAFLQLQVLDAKVVSIRDIDAATSTEESKRPVQEFIASYPDDFLIKGDEKNLIVAISQKIHALGMAGIQSSQEVFCSDDLSDVDQSKLVAITSLTTNTGKRVDLTNYRPPVTKGPGALYYFPRKLPDGTPLVAAADKELLFKTVIHKRQVKIKFDLGRLKYQGKLEI
jgi:hypothetical protein